VVNAGGPPCPSPRRPARRTWSTATSPPPAGRSARAQTTTSWGQLERQLGSALPRTTRADRVQILTLVDQATPADQALLSSLVAAGDSDMTMSYCEVAAALGLELPSGDDDLRDVLDADVQQVHSYWHRR
jgi:hypothetical protein